MPAKKEGERKRLNIELPVDDYELFESFIKKGDNPTETLKQLIRNYKKIKDLLFEDEDDGDTFKKIVETLLT